MKTFTIYAPPPDDRSYENRSMDYKFIKEGYALWAGLFGPLWLLAKAIWIEGALYMVALIIFTSLLHYLGFNATAQSCFTFLANLVFGLFARDVERMYYERLGYEMISVINGKSAPDCEASYFRSQDRTKTENQEGYTI